MNGITFEIVTFQGKYSRGFELRVEITISSITVRALLQQREFWAK
jgi:hypothetical protein